MIKFVNNINDQEIEILIDGKIFSETIILRSCYEHQNNYTFKIKNINDDYYLNIKTKNNKKINNDFIDNFYDDIIFQKLRVDIDNKTGDLRKKMIESALGYSLEPLELSKEVEQAIEYVYYKNTKQTKNNTQTSKIINSIQQDDDYGQDKEEILKILKELEKE